MAYKFGTNEITHVMCTKYAKNNRSSSSWFEYVSYSAGNQSCSQVNWNFSKILQTMEYQVFRVGARYTPRKVTQSWNLVKFMEVGVSSSWSTWILTFSPLLQQTWYMLDVIISSVLSGDCSELRVTQVCGEQGTKDKCIHASISESLCSSESLQHFPSD